MLGMEQVMYRSSPCSPQGSISVIQLEDPTFCAASWPVAMYIAVIMFAACALNPPKEQIFLSIIMISGSLLTNGCCHGGSNKVF